MRGAGGVHRTEPRPPGGPGPRDTATLLRSTSPGASVPDLRVVVLGVAAWVGGLAAFLLPRWAVGGLAAVAVVWACRRLARGRPVLTLIAAVLAAAAVAGVAEVRIATIQDSRVAQLAAQRAEVTVTGRMSTDPVLRKGRFGEFSLVRVTVTDIRGRGRRTTSRMPVLVLGTAAWAEVPLGSQVTTTGRLGPADGADLAGVLSTRRAPLVVAGPGRLLGGAAVVRGGIRDAVSGSPPDARALVPALVTGDDQQMSADVVEDFRTCGLTHLAAVSGTNLTLVVGFLLLVARWAGVRARALVVVGALGVLGFVLLARPEPSVLRAAAMGSVALVGMGSRTRDLGVRALGVAVLVLLLVDPWLAVSIGFALSTLATAGILFLGPPLRDALRTWLPRWLAEAGAVPMAAQLACTPVIAAISGQVSLVAVPANLAVDLVVGPATVLGLVGGLLVLVLPPLGHLCGWLAGLCGSWIVAVASHLARLPNAALDWSVGVVSVTVLVVVCLAVGLGAGGLLRRRGWFLAVCALLVVVLTRPLPTPGWPPPDWALVACDVGQGDGLVLNAGGGLGVAVDAGPDPQAMDRCLRRLHVRALPVVVLTHFHADHIDGLPAVLGDHRVAELDVTATQDPAHGAAEVHRWAAAARVPVRVPPVGEVRRVGSLTWQVLGPVRPPASSHHGEEGSVPNNASLVLLVETRGVRILMSGDMEPEAQQALARTYPQLRADVLKVPHHGSRYQDARLLSSLGARLAVVSVGVDNDYGHPAAGTLALLRRAGMRVERTDRDGDIAVSVRDGHLSVHERGGHSP